MITHKLGYKTGLKGLVLTAFLSMVSVGAYAADGAPVLDTGNTAWIITSTVLVLLMSIPGIALFYGGLVRQKNVLSLIMQTLFIVGVVSIIWVVFGYSWAFGTGFAESGNPLGALIGGFDKCFLNGITVDSVESSGIPTYTWVMFQCMFALITPALILGAFAERIKFKGYMIFIILWVIVAYFPMAHWVWGGGFLQQMGAIDFAGGTVVHINAGVSALVMALMIGKREDYRVGHPIIPHNITLVFMGTCFLWLGWFGFNGASAFNADPYLVSYVFVTTCLAACTGCMTAMLTSWTIQKKPDLSMMLNGALAGLVAITAGADCVSITSSLVIGGIAGVIVVLAVMMFDRLYLDDPVGALSVHLVNGVFGTLAVGIFSPDFKLLPQLIGVVAVGAASFLCAMVIFLLLKKFWGLRATDEEQIRGLDLSEHGMEAYGGFQIFQNE